MRGVDPGVVPLAAPSLRFRDVGLDLSHGAPRRMRSKTCGGGQWHSIGRGFHRCRWSLYTYSFDEQRRLVCIEQPGSTSSRGGASTISDDSSRTGDDRLSPVTYEELARAVVDAVDESIDPVHNARCRLGGFWRRWRARRVLTTNGFVGKGGAIPDYYEGGSVDLLPGNANAPFALFHNRAGDAHCRTPRMTAMPFLVMRLVGTRVT